MLNFLDGVDLNQPFIRFILYSPLTTANALINTELAISQENVTTLIKPTHR